MRLMFNFAGTGVKASEMFAFFETSLKMSNDFSSDVIRVYVDGAQHENVGNGLFNPDLSIAAKKIVSAFLQCGVLDLSRLENNFGDAIIICGPKVEGNITPITSVLLSGYSRGAVTAFFVAKALYACEKTNNIPVDIVANQPVPGRHISHSARGVSKAIDCTECTNIRKADVFVGSYRKDNGFFENNWYAQMIPSFPENTDAAFRKLAITKHNAGLRVSYAHVASIIHRYGYCVSSKDPYAGYAFRGYAAASFCAYMPDGDEQKIFMLGSNKVPIISDSTLPYLSHMDVVRDVMRDKCVENNDVNRRVVFNVLMTVNEEVNRLREDMFLAFDVDEPLPKYSLLGMYKNVYRAVASASVRWTDEPSLKYSLIGWHQDTYKDSVLKAVCDYLNNSYCDSIDDKQNLIGRLKNAEHEFCKRALNVDRAKSVRVAARILANTLFLLCTGVLLGLIYNVVTSKRDTLTDKAFPFFSQTNSAAHFSKVTSRLLQHAGASC